MATKAGIYCRISDDRAGEGLGVTRQAEDGRAYCAARGWEVADLYVDNDISATYGAPRPAYSRLLADLGSGLIGAVVAWHPDRLHRSPRELEDFIAIVDARRAKVGTVQAGEYDLTTPTGRMSARIVGAVAKHESEHKAQRIRSKHAELAAAGKLSGGGTRPFGFDADRRSINEAEAELIRGAVRRLLAGESVRGVCVDWTERGVATVSGKAWSPQVMRTMVTSGRIAGLREHHGTITATAEWPAIISAADHHRLRAIIDDPARRTTQSNARSYLLTGFAYCRVCGARLVARRRGGDHKRRYICAKGPGYAGCGHIGIIAATLEDHVVTLALAYIDSPALSEALRALTDNESAEDASAELAAAEAMMVTLAQDWAAGEIDRISWQAARKPLTARIEAARRSLSRSGVNDALRGYAAGGDTLRKGWADLSFDRRRAVLATVIDRVVIGPAIIGDNRFQPQRVSVEWKG